jgi:uncharacterized protein (TIGR00304 family)
VEPVVTSSVTEAGFILIIFGFVLAAAAMVLLAFRSAGGSGKTRAAGVLLIGPIPIIFGTDKDSVKGLMILAIVLILVVLIVMVLPYLFGR